MYTILMTNDKKLVATVKTAIQQRETNIDTLRLLVPNYYMNFDLSQFVAVVKYTTADGKTYCEQLLPQAELYNNYIDYRLGIDTGITSVAGNVDLRLTLLHTDKNETGQIVEHILHTNDITIPISPIKDTIFIPDTLLESVDQILLKIDSKILELNEIAGKLQSNKADDIEVIDGEIYMVSTDPVTGEKTPLGDPIMNPAPSWSPM